MTNLPNKEIKNFIEYFTIIPMRESIRNDLNKIQKNSKIKVEISNLLNQSNSSIKNAHLLLENNEIVDAITLLRSSLEKMAMAVLINSDDENIYKEFKDIDICGSPVADYTRVFQILKRFSLKLKIFCPELFNDFSDKNVIELIENLYKDLSNYVHSSIFVSLEVEIKNNNDQNLFKNFYILLAYFIELLLYISLESFEEKKGEGKVDVFCLFLGCNIIINNTFHIDNYEQRVKKYIEIIENYYTDEYKHKLEKNKNKILNYFNDSEINISEEINIEDLKKIINEYVEEYQKRE